MATRFQSSSVALPVYQDFSARIKKLDNYYEVIKYR
jgi:hypothetical protein